MDRECALLSIVIPAHNASKTISRCLDSIPSAGRIPVEVIIVDDGSADDLASAVRSSKIGTEVRLLRQEAQGVSVARNRGVEASAGSHILFVDADDYLPENSLPEFFWEAVDSGADICIGDFLMEKDGNLTFYRNVNGRQTVFDAGSRDVFQWLCLARVGFGREKNVGLLGGPWAKVYRRDFLDDVFGGRDIFVPGVRRGQDVLFNVEAFGRAQLVGYHRRPTYVYSISAASASHRETDDFVDRVDVLVTKLDQLIMGEGWDYLAPAVAKVRLTLLEEAIGRMGRNASLNSIRGLASSKTFAAGLSDSRLRDCSLAGALKLVLLRAGAYRAYRALAAFRSALSRA